ncbi:hypothetical protein FB451DRAFT_1258815 [Mycena latifolia]|nr:hypothetical protein FB451DRAFT_1258815 [Mycena latifolia]
MTCHTSEWRPRALQLKTSHILVYRPEGSRTSDPRPRAGSAIVDFLHRAPTAATQYTLQQCGPRPPRAPSIFGHDDRSALPLAHRHVKQVCAAPLPRTVHCPPPAISPCGSIRVRLRASAEGRLCPSASMTWLAAVVDPHIMRDERARAARVSSRGVSLSATPSGTTTGRRQARCGGSRYHPDVPACALALVLCALHIPAMSRARRCS